MDLNLNNLVSSGLLLPAAQPPEHMQTTEIHQIVIFEPENPSFPDSVEEQTLLFFPRGTGRHLNGQMLEVLTHRSCAAVRYRDDITFPSNAERLLPTFLIPGDSDISRTVSQCCQLAYSGMQRLAEASLETMERLSKELLHHKGKGESIIRIAAELLECPVAFVTSDFHLQNTHDTSGYLVLNPFCNEDSFNWESALESIPNPPAASQTCLAEGINGNRINGYLYRNHYCRKQGCRIFIFPIVDEGNCYGYLLLSLDERTDALSPERSIKIQQILAIMKFEIIKSDEIAHTVNRYYDFLLDELVESEQTDFRKLMQKYGLVQKVIYDEYYVLIAGRTPQSTSDTFFHELLTSQQFNALYDHLVNAMGTINFFLFERKDYIVTLLPKQLVSRGKPDFERVISLFREFLQDQYNGVGISGIVPTERVRQGYLQALKALAISQHSLNKASCYYDELGILRFFFDRSNQVDFAPLLQVYQEYIQPITDYDSRHSGDLLPTLTAYITCCASPSAICNLLYIHKNTLYARLNKISQILGKDLSDSETVFNLSLGLKIQTLIQAGILDRDLDP